MFVILNSRKRRRALESKRPQSRISLLCGSISLVSILIFLLFIFIAAKTAGNIAQIVAGISLLAMIVSFVSLIFGIKAFRNKSFSSESRWFGLLPPVFSTILWMALYFTGMLIG